MKKLFAILIMCSLSLPVFAVAEQEVETTQTETNNNLEVLSAEEVDELNRQALPEIDTSNINNTLPSKFKEPVSKKKLAKKFLIAMLCVVGTSVFLYVTLSLYNKLRDALAQSEPAAPEGEQPLQSPVDLSEAVKTFVDKTHWDG